MARTSAELDIILVEIVAKATPPIGVRKQILLARLKELQTGDGEQEDDNE